MYSPLWPHSSFPTVLGVIIVLAFILKWLVEEVKADTVVYSSFFVQVFGIITLMDLKYARLRVALYKSSDASVKIS